MRTITLILIVLAAAGCGSAAPSSAPVETTLAHDPVKPIATVRGSVPGTSLGLISLRRSGKVVTAKVRVLTEPSARTFADAVDLSVANDVLDDSVSMRLIDEVNGREHFPLVDEEEHCLCSHFSRLEPGEDADLYAKVPAPPRGVTRVSLHVRDFPSFDDIVIAP